jgi:hypothetical protein
MNYPSPGVQITIPKSLKRNNGVSLKHASFLTVFGSPPVLSSNVTWQWNAMENASQKDDIFPLTPTLP